MQYFYLSNLKITTQIYLIQNNNHHLKTMHTILLLAFTQLSLILIYI